ncbi:hypothetical protein AAU61_09090 [Desulfocarbo indianensis]|nr:hypothetical protein AAU61_09090 [Desulfocarbo indianensis]
MLYPSRPIYNQAMLARTTQIAAAGILFCLLFLAGALCPASVAQAQVKTADRYCIWLLWTKDPALIKGALTRLAQGEPFMVVARDTARAHPKTSQANADCMTAAGMDPLVLAVARELSIGQISRPFDLGGGSALVMRTTDEHRRLAQELYAQGRFARAERELLRDLKLHPASAPAWHMLALTRTAQGHYKEALAALDKALALTPDNPAMLNDQASALANLGKPKAALPIFEKALKLDPKNPTIISNLAWALTLAGKQPERAEKLAQQACQEAPGQARYWHTLGKVQAAQGRHGKAVASLRQALLFDPQLNEAGQDLLKSVLALDAKVVERLGQAPEKPTAKKEAKEDEPFKGLKRAPDLAAPPFELPSRWPALPPSPAVAQKAAPAGGKPVGQPPRAPAAPAAPPEAVAASGASGRVVSLPMPKFPEQVPARARDDRPLPAGEGGPAALKTDPPTVDKASEPAKPPENQKPTAAPAKAEPGQAPTAVAASAEAKAAPKTTPPSEGKASEPAKPPKGQEADGDKAKSPPGQAPKAAAAPAAAKAAPKKDQTEKTATPPAEPAAAPDPKPAGPYFLIQVASFRPESLAQKELRSWQRRKVPVSIENWRDRRGRAWHRVLLGPYPSQKQAEEQARALKKRGWVRDYRVVKRPSD